MTEESPQRWKVLCAYDGRGFAGWQSQKGGDGIQDVIEARLARILPSAPRIHASGRTDAGVHARGQVFHFDAPWKHGPTKLAAALSAGLPESLQIRSVQAVSSSFHARFSATGKTYRYHLHLGPADPFTSPYCWGGLHSLELRRMRQAAKLLVGRHDFQAFSAFNGSERNDTVRELRRLSLSTHGRRIIITAEADGFLYKMVRSLVGALVAVGQGKLSLERLPILLKGAARNSEVPTAPARGLFLDSVRYAPCAPASKGSEKRPR